MKTAITLIVTFFATLAFAQPAKEKSFNDDFFPSRVNLGYQEDQSYWPVAIGILYMPLPTN